MMNRFLPFILFLILGYSCTNDELAEPSEVECDTAVTYTSDIKAIVESSCSYEGCHSSAASIGDFTSFENMSGVIGNASFEKRVVTQKNMPPSNTPSGRPENLTEEELNLVRCWIQDGYPE